MECSLHARHWTKDQKQHYQIPGSPCKVDVSSFCLFCPGINTFVCTHSASQEKRGLKPTSSIILSFSVLTTHQYFQVNFSPFSTGPISPPFFHRNKVWGKMSLKESTVLSLLWNGIEKKGKETILDILVPVWGCPHSVPWVSSVCFVRPKS